MMIQVTAQIGVNNGKAPFYDFELQFEATSLPSLGLRRYRISPKADADCSGGDLHVQERGFAVFARHGTVGHSEALSKARRADVIQEAIRRQGDSCGDPDRWNRIVREVEDEVLAESHGRSCKNVTLKNSFLEVSVDLCHGVAAVYDVATKTNYSLTHELMAWPSTSNDAYGAGITAPHPVLENTTVSSTVAIGPVLQEVWLQISPEHKTRIRVWNSADPAVGGRIEFGHRIGVLEPFTEVSSRFTLVKEGRWTLHSEDNGCVTYGLSRTVVYSRLSSLTHERVFGVAYRSYEKIQHQPPPAGYDNSTTPNLMYPSQMSVFGTSDTVQLSLALDRSHAVGSLIDGTIDVMQHRRGGPFIGGQPIVLDVSKQAVPKFGTKCCQLNMIANDVMTLAEHTHCHHTHTRTLDRSLALSPFSHMLFYLQDVDRIFTETWLSVGPTEESNRMRIAMRQRLNHPLVLAAGLYNPKSTPKLGAHGVMSLPAQVCLWLFCWRGVRVLFVRWNVCAARATDAGHIPPS
jgi:hypothetical protein